MSRRSRKHRKHFSCGHRGFGQFCHRCADEERNQQITLMIKQDLNQRKQLEQQRWRESFAKDSIDLTHLPKKIVLKARYILRQLAKGTDFQKLGGKKLVSKPFIGRIPVTYRYRLVGQIVGHNFVPLKVVSHETYNRITRIGVG